MPLKARPDAPPTLSKSCTDKLTLKSCTSLLSNLASLLIVPTTAYLHSLVLPQSQHVPAAIIRAFSQEGRMSALNMLTTSGWPEGYSFRPFKVETTSREFRFSRRSTAKSEQLIPCNLSAISTPYFQETLINGALQGRKQFDPRGASRICRKSMWAATKAVAMDIGDISILNTLRTESYLDLKQAPSLHQRRMVVNDVKAALRGWAKNEGDESFSLNDTVS